MKDIEKILDRIHKEQDGLMDAQGNFEYPEHEGAYHALCDLEAYVESLAKEPVSEDLEEEFVSYIKEKFGVRQEGDKLKTDGLNISPYDLLDIANHFANWQKRQMMKDVVLETTVIRNDAGCAEDGNYSSWLEYEDYEVIKMPKWAKAGDKVKLIIVKEAEK